MLCDEGIAETLLHREEAAGALLSIRHERSSSSRFVHLTAALGL